MNLDLQNLQGSLVDRNHRTATNHLIDFEDSQTWFIEKQDSTLTPFVKVRRTKAGSGKKNQCIMGKRRENTSACGKHWGWQVDKNVSWTDVQVIDKVGRSPLLVLIAYRVSSSLVCADAILPHYSCEVLIRFVKTNRIDPPTLKDEEEKTYLLLLAPPVTVVHVYPELCLQACLSVIRLAESQHCSHCSCSLLPQSHFPPSCTPGRC